MVALPRSTGVSDSTRLLARAREYARRVPLDVDHSRIDWEISARAKRRAGACRHHPEADRVTIRLARRAYDRLDWDAFAGVVRHELVHAWEFQAVGEAGHGPRFHEKARELDAPRHCPQFTDHRLVLACADCDWTAGRHRASPPVKFPGRYGCGRCGGAYRVEHVATGRTWTTNSGYHTARRLVADW
jgi:predicted SprT family Zn-dependent metalloprotease